MSDGDVIVDDHLLLRVLLDDEPAELRPRGGRLATTGLWYHRLCRAIADPTITGAMSRRLGAGDPDLGAAAVRAITSLPDEVACVPLRILAWPMARAVAGGARGNLLSLEAIAAAEHLDATLCLAADDDNRPLLAAARVRGVEVRVLV